MDLRRFEKLPIMGIMRGISSVDLKPLIEATIDAGLETLEITMNTEGASGLIKEAVRLSDKKLIIGAGTVLDMKSLKSALDAGAAFIVMPVLIKDVAEYCAKNKIPFFPGGLTPCEIYSAWGSGASMVKVFPAKFFGPEYFKEIKGPFPDIKLLACAGVTPENLGSFFANGASAVAFGASVFRKDWLENKEYAKIRSSVAAYIREFRCIKGLL